MSEIIIVGEGEGQPGQQEHCPACEARFADLEKRLSAIEEHHPILDANTSQAQRTADAALAMAEEAQQTADTAAIVAEIATIAEESETALDDDDDLPEQEPEEEEITDVEMEPVNTGTESTRESETEGETGEKEGGNDEPIVLSIQPDINESDKRTTGYRFARGRKR